VARSYFWEEDVHTIAAQWEKYHAAAQGSDSQSEGAQRNLQEWKEERKNIVKHMEEVCA